VGGNGNGNALKLTFSAGGLGRRLSSGRSWSWRWRRGFPSIPLWLPSEKIVSEEGAKRAKVCPVRRPARLGRREGHPGASLARMGVSPPSQRHFMAQPQFEKLRLGRAGRLGLERLFAASKQRKELPTQDLGGRFSIATVTGARWTPGTRTSAPISHVCQERRRRPWRMHLSPAATYGTARASFARPRREKMDLVSSSEECAITQGNALPG